MIRVSTIFWVGLAGAVGFGLYHLKHQVQALEDDLFRVNRAILAEQEAIHVLDAEWSYINQPARLEALALRHLDLRPTQPAQIGTIAGLPPRADQAASPAPVEPASSTAIVAAPASLRSSPLAPGVR